MKFNSLHEYYRKDRAIYAAEKDKDDSYQITLSFANLSCTVGKGIHLEHQEFIFQERNCEP